MNDNSFSPNQFTRCPDCRRSNTVVFTIHTDGDGWFKCEACGAYASAPKLNESPREWR